MCRGKYVALGTDGFGRSDTRAALRSFFEVDAKSVVVAALAALGSPLPPMLGVDMGSTTWGGPPLPGSGSACSQAKPSSFLP